jgi:hypothetical protein
MRPKRKEAVEEEATMEIGERGSLIARLGHDALRLSAYGGERCGWRPLLSLGAVAHTSYH